MGIRYDGDLEPWLKGMWSKLLEIEPIPAGKTILGNETLFPASFSVAYHPPSQAPQAPQPVSYGEGTLRYIPYNARVITNRRITAPDHDQDVRHIEFDLGNSNLTYQPGDVLLVHPQNSPDLVIAFAKFMGLELDGIITIAENKAIHANADIDALALMKRELELPSSCTVRELFSNYLDFLGTPRRHFFEVSCQLGGFCYPHIFCMP